MPILLAFVSPVTPYIAVAAAALPHGRLHSRLQRIVSAPFFIIAHVSPFAPGVSSRI